jgi:hypothetical protein
LGSERVVRVGRDEALRSSSRAVPWLLRPGGTAFVNAPVEIPDDLDTIRETLRRWFGDGVANRISTRLLRRETLR